MKQITFPIEENSTGEAVATLHAVLKVLGYQVDPKEVLRKHFGDTTIKAVAQFQKDNGLPFSQKIDDVTAKALNKRSVDVDSADVILELKGQGNRLGNIDSRLGEQGGMLGNIDGKLGEHGAKLGSIDSRLGEQGGMLGNIDGKLGEHGAKLGSIDSRLGEQGGRLGNIYGKLGEHDTKLGSIDSRIGDQGAELGNIDTKLGDHGTKLGNIQAGLESVGDTSKFQLMVNGHVRLDSGRPVAGCLVCAFHAADKDKVKLGEDSTDIEGNYSIRYGRLAGRRAEVDPIRLGVVAVDANGRALCDPVLKDNAGPREVIDLTVPVAGKPAAQGWIEGRIILDDGRPAEKDLGLGLYRLDFGGNATLLTETKTLGEGYYSLAYPLAQRATTLVIRAVAAGTGKTVSLSKPLADLPERAEINLMAPGDLQPLAAEYRRLSADLTPHVVEMSKLAGTKEYDKQPDLTSLNSTTGWDARLIALAATTERLAADSEVNLSQEALYGLLRVGLPSDKLLLAQVEPETAELALKKARDAGVVQLTEEDIAQFKTSFTMFAGNTRLAMLAPGSHSTYGELLDASGAFTSNKEGEEARNNFASLYLSHHGNAEQLWERVRRAGLGDSQIGKLQRQGKFAFLTGNSERMTTRLLKMELKDPADLVEQDFYRPDTWAAEVFNQACIPPDRWNDLTVDDRNNLEKVIPATFVGEEVKVRLDAYAEDMARKVRLSYPTQVVGRLIEQDEIKLPAARDATVTLMRNASGQGFRLGATPVEVFLKTHAGVRDGMADNEFQAAQHQMKTLQRVYQITPSNEAMPVLISLGITSAYDVMAYSEVEFGALYDRKYFDIHGKVPTQAESRLVYRKAKQVSSVTYNLFTIAKKLDSEPSVAGMSASVEVRESVRNELIKQFPTMESLFGSMDFCECEHCRSVLSPAAYLVDLLQFIDPESGDEKSGESKIWTNFLARWKETHGQQDYPHKDDDGTPMTPYDVLIKRRPDLPHIPLTCENTHTALPYIDVVNEILEYYVANDALTKDAAHDTGDATTLELLAEPQNVIGAAYDKLRKAHYPLTLPFDLWIETVRQFFNYSEMPLARVLEVFRLNDDLFASAQPFDRSTIFMESLGLSPAETAIFTDADPLAKWHELYGFTTAAEATTEATDATTGQRIDLNSAKVLSRRLGVTYKEIAEIVQTGFVNPKLAKLGVLYKLGVSVQDARFHHDYKGLLPQDPTTLTPEDQKRRLEVEAFSQELGKLAVTFNVSTAQLEVELQAIPFDSVLVLADPDAGCDFDLTTLRYANGDRADAIAFLKINLFVRLWRKLGWSIEETDRALQAFVPKNAPFEKDHLNKQPLKTALIYLAHLKALDANLPVGQQSRIKLTTLWADIATTGKKPLYAQLFLTRSVLKASPVFDHPLGQYLSVAGVAAVAQSRKHRVQLENVVLANKIDPAPFAAKPMVELSYDELQEVQYFSFEGLLSDAEKAVLSALSPSPALPSLLDAVQVKAREFSLVKGHLVALQGALGLTADEISRILVDAAMSIDAAELSLPNVSLLYRYGLLAKALKLSVRELIALKQLSGLDPFTKLHPEPLADTSAGIVPSKKAIEFDYPFSHTLRFVEVAEKVKESGLKIEDLEYLLRHRFDDTGKYRPNSDATLALLKTLAQGIRAIRAEHAVPDDPGAMSEEVLRQKLGLAMPSDVVEHFLAMMNGTAEFTATKSPVVDADQLHSTSFIGELAISQVAFNSTRQEQKLVFRGVLFDAQKADLKAKFNATLAAGQQLTFTDLLEEVQMQARQQASTFFLKHLEKQALNPSVTTGFLDTADFDLLFDSALAAGETEQDRVRNRRVKLANAFLPFLQARLIRQFIVQTMTAQTAADPVLVESLLTDERLLASPKPLLEAFTTTGERGVSADFFDSVDGSGLRQLTSPSVMNANTALKAKKDKDGNPLNPANSARFEGYLEVPTPGAYRFYMALDKQNAEAELRFPDFPKPVVFTGKAAKDKDELGKGETEFVELKPGIPYRFTLDINKLNGGEAWLLVQGETMPKESVSQLTLYPLTAIQGAERAVLLLTKALQLVQSLGLNEREIRYLLTHAAAFDGLSLSQLPTRSSGDTPAGAKALFGQFLRLAAYARLKQDLAGGTDDLIEIFEANETIDADKLNKKVYPLIAKLTRRDEAMVKATAKALVTAPAAPVFESEKPLKRLWEALQVVERFGVPVASLLEWTRIVGPAATPEQRFEIARDLKEAIKARFEPEKWQRVAQPIFDKLRQRQRDALVSQVMHQHGFDRMEQLYEYFLIDPGMEPVVQTSRIRLAIASLQLFIQRCLLNMELQVHPSVINSKQWEWMKRYRVWEANRKIFLFPENWLEPEFRDDKTHLFAELEGALLQGDVSSDLVEDAFLNYLKKLDELARLDIVAMHLEDNPDPALHTLHVIGRTYSQPHKYFYRRYAHQMWTSWEPVTAEIEGDHLAPVVWRDRLYLFWVTFMEKAEQPVTSGYFSGVAQSAMDQSAIDTCESSEAVTPLFYKSLAAPKKEPKLIEMTLSQVTGGVMASAGKRTIEAQLHWSEYLQGEWRTRESGGFGATSPVVVTGVSNFNSKGVFVHVSKEPYEDGEERGVHIHLGGMINQAFYLAGRNSAPEKDSYATKPGNPYNSANTELATRYSGSGEFKVSFQERITTEPGKTPPKANPSILQQGGGYTLLPCDNNLTALGVSEDAYQNASNSAAVKAAIDGEIASLMKPVFYQDNAHALFVEPNVTERTIEEWQDWVTRTPQPEPVWRDTDWWKDIVVIPEVPKKWPIPDPRNPRGNLRIDPRSLTRPMPGADWLVNPGTGLLFDGVLIGPAGRPRLEILTEEVAGVMADGGTPVNVNPGSGLASGSTVVHTGTTTLEQDGLTQLPGGLNIVGGGGFNSALAKNLNEFNRSGLGAGMPGAGRFKR